MTSSTVSARAFPSTDRWTREQTLLAFQLYCQTPFGKIDGRNTQIIALARLIGRTADALAMKCLNIASIDPVVRAGGRVGLGNASALDRSVWAEFHADWERLATECAQLRQHLLHEREAAPEEPRETGDDFVLDDYTGETRTAIIQQRVKQDFFRRAVLASYRGRCCVSGVSDSRLLVASHIVPWRDDKANRLNPSNGLCLSAIHDKAFDSYLFSLTDDGHILLSRHLKVSRDAFIRDVFTSIDGKQIELPERFAPSSALIRRHRNAMLDREGV